MQEGTLSLFPWYFWCLSYRLCVLSFRFPPPVYAFELGHLSVCQRAATAVLGEVDAAAQASSGACFHPSPAAIARELCGAAVHAAPVLIKDARLRPSLAC